MLIFDDIGDVDDIGVTFTITISLNDTTTACYYDDDDGDVNSYYK